MKKKKKERKREKMCVYIELHAYQTLFKFQFHTIHIDKNLKILQFFFLFQMKRI